MASSQRIIELENFARCWRGRGVTQSCDGPNIGQSPCGLIDHNRVEAPRGALWNACDRLSRGVS